MLGVVHRAALGEGPPQLRDMMRRRPGSYMLQDPCEGATTPHIMKRSIWGLLSVYNRLGSGTQNIESVREFQQYLQERVKKLLRAGQLDGWTRTYSPR